MLKLRCQPLKSSFGQYPIILSWFGVNRTTPTHSRLGTQRSALRLIAELGQPIPWASSANDTKTFGSLDQFFQKETL